MLKGGLYKHCRLTVAALTLRSWFDDMGIETSWGATTMSLHDPRVAQSNDFAESLLDLVFAVVAKESTRLLPYMYGHPEQCTLLLDDASRAATLEQFRLDVSIAGCFVCLTSARLGVSCLFRVCLRSNTTTLYKVEWVVV